MMNVCKGFQYYLGAPAEVKGIGSILSEGDAEATQRSMSSSQSLRRTLSADMLSQGWMSRENSLRKSCSFYELPRNSFSESEEFSESESEDRSDEGEDGDIFSMTEEEEEEEEREEKGLDAVEKGSGDLWSLILSEKKKKESNSSFFALVAPTSKDLKVDSSKWEPCKPYVHPAKKKCKLSDQSLRLCTESLGCESGTDCSYPSLSDTEDCSSASCEENSSVFGEDSEEEEKIGEGNVKISENGSGSEQEKEVKSKRSFPPPLSSIARSDGPCIHMRSFKQDGRLLLKAVQVETSQKYLRAHREDGRLQLHLIRSEEDTISEKIQAEHDDESNAQMSKAEEDLQQQQFKQSSSAFPLLVSNLRRHVLRSEYQNPSRNNELQVNLHTNSTAKAKLSLSLKNAEVQGSNLGMSSKEMNSFSKLPSPGAGFEEIVKERSSQSLITSPALLFYKHQAHSSSAGNLESKSLPKFPCNESFRRCHLRQWLTKLGEPALHCHLIIS